MRRLHARRQTWDQVLRQGPWSCCTSFWQIGDTLSAPLLDAAPRKIAPIWPKPLSSSVERSAAEQTNVGAACLASFLEPRFRGDTLNIFYSTAGPGCFCSLLCCHQDFRKPCFVSESCKFHVITENQVCVACKTGSKVFKSIARTDYIPTKRVVTCENDFIAYSMSPTQNI